MDAAPHRRLIELIDLCTRPYRNGPPQEARTLASGIHVLELYDMAPVPEPPALQTAGELVLVDLLFITVGVNRTIADRNANEILIEILKLDEAMLVDGPGYIALGAVLGDQQLALQLFALGEVLGLWKIMSGLSLGAPRPAAVNMAGQGFLYIAGFKPPTDVPI